MCETNASSPQSSELSPETLEALLSMPQYEQALDLIPCGIAIYESRSDTGRRILSVNAELCRMSGYSREALMQAGADQICRAVDEDAPAVQERFRDFRPGTTVTADYRTRIRGGALRWFHMQANLYRVSATVSRIFIAYSDITADITREKALQVQLETEMQKTNIALDHADIILWVYDIIHHRSIQQPKAIAEFGTPLVVENMPYGVIESGFVLEESVQDYIDLHRAVDAGAPFASADIAMRLADGSKVYKRETYYTIFEGGVPVRAIGIATDITEEINYAVRQKQLDLALNATSLAIWSYDIQNRTFDGRGRGSERLGFGDGIVEGGCEALIRDGYILPDSAETYRALHQRLEEGAPSATATIHFNSQMVGIEWQKITYSTLFDDKGRPTLGIGIGEDVSELVNAQRRFQKELDSLQAAEDESLLVKSRANLTRDLLESHQAKARIAAIPAGSSYTRLVEAVAQAAFTEAEHAMVHRMLDRDRLLAAFEKGEDRCTIEYRCRLRSGELRWVRTSAKLSQDPSSGDIVSFLYTTDIHEHKTSQLMVERIMDFGFEFLGLLDLPTGQLLCIRQAELEQEMQCAARVPYETEYRRFVQLYMAGETQAEALEALSPDHIRRQLDALRYYTCAFPTHRNGASSNKKWEFSYLDESKQQIVFARSDITEVTRQQEQQKEALRLALVQAEQANVAKTEFLSRMSHEIRTPMNAIIGMSALAAQCVDKPDEVADCIAKVGISARFLLSLINDILDMSRIESGKMTLKQEPILFEPFLRGINAICYEQTADKGIDYECVLATHLQDAYLGDAMKLQQVLLNLLGNAIKFTPAGGKVQLVVSQERSHGGRAHLRFSVTDTGIGIGEAFLPKLFEPFEQENSGVTSQYGGTGLGLAISKNLVTMMGGTIRVTSIPGVGSEFTVSLDLPECRQEPARQVGNGLVLGQLEALVVDDDVMICQNTQTILEDMGVHASWVDSGFKAVEQVRCRWEQQQAYDIILIDWKMPEMDGIETTRQLRRIVGPDVTIIIMTSYDWVSIEAEARAAGVNLLVTKPLFPSTLMSAFEKVYSEKQAETAVSEEERFDFSGRRILLVEDNAINTEVAKRLLQAKGAEVDTAENGLDAIERFTTAPDRHYDLILMDIRMPVMDGLTAARSIRHLKKEAAKEIPIIAMSANAFQEDVDKSLSAGMNAHLSKPIEPPLLYQTLQNFFL